MGILRLSVLFFLISVLALGCSPKREQASSIANLGIEEDKDVIQTIVTPEAVETQAVQQVQQSPAQSAQPIQVGASAGQNAAAQSASEGLERKKQIQLALKNANLYFGEIDGKFGPMTKKAIEEFQRMKGLKADGKVGPVTWGELQKYLSAQPDDKTTVQETKKKR